MMDNTPTGPWHYPPEVPPDVPKTEYGLYFVFNPDEKRHTGHHVWAWNYKDQCWVDDEYGDFEPVCPWAEMNDPGTALPEHQTPAAGQFHYDSVEQPTVAGPYLTVNSSEVPTIAFWSPRNGWWGPQYVHRWAEIHTKTNREREDHHDHEIE